MSRNKIFIFMLIWLWNLIKVPETRINVYEWEKANVQAFAIHYCMPKPSKKVWSCYVDSNYTKCELCNFAFCNNNLYKLKIWMKFKSDLKKKNAWQIWMKVWRSTPAITMQSLKELTLIVSKTNQHLSSCHMNICFTFTWFFTNKKQQQLQI